MRRGALVLLAVIGCAVFAVPSRAGDDIQVDPAEMVKGLQKDVLAQIDDAAQKLAELSDATPATKYGWRPSRGVRTTGEVYVHVAAANYALASFIGVKPPDGVDPMKLEKTIRTKAEISDLLRKSFVHARRAVASVPDAELEQEVSFFGQKSTKRGVMLMFVSHAHEHLGQSIAYARVNRVVPPWTARAEAELAKSKSSAAPN